LLLFVSPSQVGQILAIVSSQKNLAHLDNSLIEAVDVEILLYAAVEATFFMELGPECS
jgi:hypothetical protein